MNLVVPPVQRAEGSPANVCSAGFPSCVGGPSAAGFGWSWWRSRHVQAAGAELGVNGLEVCEGQGLAGLTCPKKP